MTAPVMFPDCVPVLTDGVVTLRAHTEDDIQALYEQAIDSQMLRWTTVPDPSNLETAREFACKIVPSGWEEGRAWEFAVEAPDDDGRSRFVGTVGLRNEEHGRAEIAFGAHPWARGRGYVVRALELLLEWGFRERTLRTVLWQANKGNWASRKVAWRLGFSFDGTVRQWLPQRGALHDAWTGTLASHEERSPRSPWLDVPRLHGRRVALRAFRDSDSPRIVEACSDELSRQWLPDLPTPYTFERAREYVEGRREQRATGSGVTWAIADPDTDELLGNIAVMDIGPGREGEIGYWMHPASRGRGLMTRACGLVVRHCFVPAEDGGLGLRRLTVIAAEGNVASRRVIEANGFVEVGRMRQENRMRDGSYVDAFLYDLLASEYSARVDVDAAGPGRP